MSRLILKAVDCIYVSRRCKESDLILSGDTLLKHLWFCRCQLTIKIWISQSPSLEDWVGFQQIKNLSICSIQVKISKTLLRINFLYCLQEKPSKLVCLSPGSAFRGFHKNAICHKIFGSINQQTIYTEPASSHRLISYFGLNIFFYTFPINCAVSSETYIRPPDFQHLAKLGLQTPQRPLIVNSRAESELAQLVLHLKLPAALHCLQ